MYNVEGHNLGIRGLPRCIAHHVAEYVTCIDVVFVNTNPWGNVHSRLYMSFSATRLIKSLRCVTGAWSARSRGKYVRFLFVWWTGASRR